MIVYIQTTHQDKKQGTITVHSLEEYKCSMVIFGILVETIKLHEHTCMIEILLKTENMLYLFIRRGSFHSNGHHTNQKVIVDIS